MTKAMDKLHQWMRDEWDRRTKLVEEGNISPSDIVWINPEYRLQFSEVTAKAQELGINTDDVVSFRLHLDGVLPRS